MAAGDLKELAGEVAALQGSQRGLETGIDDLKQTTSKLADKVEKAGATSARIEAKLDAYFQRTRDEMEALFAARNSHEQRISGIERDYVPKTDAAKLQASIAEQGKEIGSLQQTKAQALTIAGLASLVITAVGGWAGRYIWPH